MSRRKYLVHSLVAAFLFALLPVRGDEALIVDRGKAKSCVWIGNPWKQGKGFLEGSGIESFLYATKAIKPDTDFRIKVRLSLRDPKGSSTTLVLGEEDYFGLGDVHGRLFVMGSMLRRQHLTVAAKKIVLRPGRIFTLEASRQGKELSFRLNRTKVYSQTLTEPLHGSVALRPWSTMTRVYDFSVSGQLEDFRPFQPPPRGEDEHVFVENGRELSVFEVGRKWRSVNGYLECGGRGNYLYATKVIKAGGDFHIRAHLSLAPLGDTSSSLVLGEDNHFGFSAADRRFFVEGPAFGKRVYGNAREFIRYLKPFYFEAIRKGEHISFRLEGKTVYECEQKQKLAGRFALRPWRAVMRVRSFTASGDLDRLPPYLPPVNPVKTPMSPLKLAVTIERVSCTAFGLPAGIRRINIPAFKLSARFQRPKMPLFKLAMKFPRPSVTLLEPSVKIGGLSDQDRDAIAEEIMSNTLAMIRARELDTADLLSELALHLRESANKGRAAKAFGAMVELAEGKSAQEKLAWLREWAKEPRHRGHKKNIAFQSVGYLYRAGKFDLAWKCIRQYRQDYKDRGDRLALLEGLCLFRQDEDEKAVEVFKAMIKAYPESQYCAQAKFLAAWVYLTNNENAEATAYLEDIVTNHAETPYAKKAQKLLKRLE